MGDYGHELLFGSFIGPPAAQADTVVALAETSERSGLDLVTFQDHPYQPAFLDAWTLLSYVAAHLSYEERELTVPLARYGMGPGQL